MALKIKKRKAAEKKAAKNAAVKSKILSSSKKASHSGLRQFSITRKGSSPSKQVEFKGLPIAATPSTFGGAVAAANAAKQKTENDFKKVKTSQRQVRPKMRVMN